jgi:hypothetical protein
VQLLQLEKYGKIRTSGRTSEYLFRLVAVTELWQQSCKTACFPDCNPSCIDIRYQMEKVFLMSDECIKVWTMDESESTVYAVDSVMQIVACAVATVWCVDQQRKDSYSSRCVAHSTLKREGEQ